MAETINILGTGGIIEGNLGTADVNVNLDASVRLSTGNTSGAGNYIGIPTNADIEALETGGTISAWAKFNSAGSAGNYPNVIGLGTGGASGLNVGIFRHSTNDSVFYSVKFADGTSSYLGSSAITHGTWNHFAISFDSGAYNSYFNGVLVSNNTTAQDLFTLGTVTRNGDVLCGAIGTNLNNVETQTNDMEVADARVYSSALGIDDIKILASRINGDPSLISASSNLLLRYKLDGNDISSSTVTNAEGTSARNGIIKRGDAAAGSSTHTFIRDAYSVDVYDGLASAGGTTTDGTFTVTQGKVEGKALSSIAFDDDRVDIGDLGDYTAISMAVWVRPHDATPTSQGIVGFDGNKNGIATGSGSNTLRIKHERVNSSFTDTTYTWLQNKWQQVGFSWDGSTLNVYAGGVQINSVSLSGNPWKTTAADIGVLVDGIWPFDGEIRDVRLYDYGLSEEQMASLYSNTYPQTPKYWYKLDEGSVSGTAINNGTASGFDGSFNGFAGTSTSGGFNGTLDLDGTLTIAAEGTLSAPRGDLELHNHFTDNGTFTHNSGEVKMTSSGRDLTGSASTVFYDLTTEGYNLVLKSAFTVENLLLSSGSNSWKFNENTTVTMGTATSQGTIQTGTAGSKGLRFTTASKTIKFAAANSLYPWIGIDGGSQWNIQAANVKVQLENCDMRFDFHTDPQAAGNNGEYELTGDCEFDAFTVGSGDTLDLNSQRAEFGGNFSLTGTLSDTGNAGIAIFKGTYTRSGTKADLNTGTVFMIEGAGSSDYHDPVPDKFFVNAGSGTVTLGNPLEDAASGTADVILGSGTLNANNQNISGRDDITIATGATYTAGSGTITCLGDFTTSGGLIGKSAGVLDGTDDYFRETTAYGTNSNLKGWTDAVTVDVWFKSAGTMSGDQILASQWASSQKPWILYVQSNGHIRWAVNGDGSGEFVTSGVDANIDDQKWHHICGTYDKTDLRLYLDGKLIGVQAQTAALQNSTDNTIFAIGAYNTNDSNTHSVSAELTGTVAKCSVWNAALTPAQIRTQMFHDHTALAADDTNFDDTLMGKLKGWWQFDEGTGAYVDNAQGTANADLLRTGATWAGAGTFDGSSATLKMTGASTFINMKDDESVGNLTIATGGDSNTVTLKDIAGGNSGLVVSGTLEQTSGKLASSNVEAIQFGQTYGHLKAASGKGAIAFADVYRFYIYQNSVSGATNFPHADSADNDITTKRLFITSSSTIEAKATGNLTITEELEVGSGNTFNANGNTIAAKEVDVNGTGTLDLSNSTLSLAYSSAALRFEDNSILLSGNSIVTGLSSAAKAYLRCHPDMNAELVGTLKFMQLEGGSHKSDITVVGAVIDCDHADSSTNIHQFFHTLDTQQLLDADEKGDDDLKLTRPSLDNALQLQTGG